MSFGLQFFHGIGVYGSEAQITKRLWLEQIANGKLFPFSTAHRDAVPGECLFAACPGSADAHRGEAGNQDPTSLWESQQHSPFRARHQPRINQSIKPPWEGKGLKKRAWWGLGWGDVFLSEKALGISFALPADSSLRGKQLLCKSIINMADT